LCPNFESPLQKVFLRKTVFPGKVAKIVKHRGDWHTDNTDEKDLN
jgi:hypothetical protein